MKHPKVGDKVIYEGRSGDAHTFTVLSFAASCDDRGRPLVEIAWGDLSASPTGYLAVRRDDLKLVPGPKYPWYACQTCGNPNVGLLGRFFDWLFGQHTHRCPAPGIVNNWHYDD